MDTRKIIELILMASLSGTGAFIASYVGKMTDSIDSMSRSVRDLNIKIEVMTTEISHTTEILRDHEARLRSVERRQLK